MLPHDVLDKSQCCMILLREVNYLFSTFPLGPHFPMCQPKNKVCTYALVYRYSCIYMYRYSIIYVYIYLYYSLFVLSKCSHNAHRLRTAPHARVTLCIKNYTFPLGAQTGRFSRSRPIPIYIQNASHRETYSHCSRTAVRALPKTRTRAFPQ